MKDIRPDPEKLLSTINEAAAKKGKLKIYLGMSAGVGKTFAMLSDAAIEKQRGADVVAGYIEPHGRVETEGLVDKFEVLRPLDIEYRGMHIKEFDLIAALERKPHIILVDELAHTNAPDLRHAKRWQDILDLMEAGIDVHTTLNVQHLESLNDVISSITGVEVRETVPDSILQKAAKIELVDIPPDELILRLKEGKIYSSERIPAALQNFFQEGNLLALREIMLRKAAEKIDGDILNYRANSNVDSIWRTNERILVAIAPNKFARRLVRTAARIALSKHAELVVVAVETPRNQFLSAQDRQLVEDALALALELDASIERRTGIDIVQEILEVAVTRNATLIVVGKPIRGRLNEIFVRSVADDLIRRSGAIEIHLVTGEIEEATTVPLVIRSENAPLVPIVYSCLIVAAATTLSFVIFPYVELTNLVMMYILATVVVSLLYGRTESLLASILSVCAFDYFFVAPRYSLLISHAEYLITFGVMLLTGLIISSLTLRLRMQGKTVAERERRTQSLYELGKLLVSATTEGEVGSAVQQSVRSLCGCDSSFLVAKGGHLTPSPSSRSQFELDDGELAVASLVLEKRQSAGACTDTLPGAQGMYLPIAIEDAAYGVLGIAVEAKNFDRSFLQMLTLLTQQAALCLQRNKGRLIVRDRS